MAALSATLKWLRTSLIMLYNLEAKGRASRDRAATAGAGATAVQLGDAPCHGLELSSAPSRAIKYIYMYLSGSPCKCTAQVVL